MVGTECERNICQRFVRGFCEYGRSCKYSHPAQVLQIAKKTTVCKHFARSGSCPVGDACNFIHDFSLRPVYDAARKNKIQPHCWAYIQGACRSRHCPMFHPMDTAPYLKYTPCSLWASCPSPQECPFKHPDPVYAVPGLEALANATVSTEESIYQAKKVNGTTYFPLNIHFQSNPTPALFNSVQILARSVHHTHSEAPPAHPVENQQSLATAAPQARAKLHSEVEQMLFTNSQNLPCIKRVRPLQTCKDHPVADSLSDPRNHGAENQSDHPPLKNQRAGHTRRFSIATNGYFNAMHGGSERSASNTQSKPTHRRQFSYVS